MKHKKTMQTQEGDEICRDGWEWEQLYPDAAQLLHTRLTHEQDHDGNYSNTSHNEVRIRLKTTAFYSRTILIYSCTAGGTVQ